LQKLIKDDIELICIPNIYYFYLLLNKIKCKKFLIAKQYSLFDKSVYG